MSQLPRYESYKNSGVQWLGEIPSHWEVKRMKFLLSEKLKYGANESAESEDKDQPRYIRITDINDSGTLREDTFKSLEIEKAQEYLLNDLDILLARSGATVGKSYLHKKDKVNVACYAGYLIRARFNKENYDPQFINLFLQSKAYWSWIESVNIQATIQNVSAEKYNDLALSIPSLAEQKIIADFLDKRLAQVDALIAKQETLLEKLAEQRVALISHAVTKGLNPDVEMKESGISWFKQIPKSWDVKQLKFVITKIQTGSTPPSAVPEYYSSDDIVWYGPADFTDENYILNESVKKISALALEDKVVKPMPKGSIMMIGIGATLGKVAITNVDCTTNQQINSLIPIEDVNAKYLMYQLNSLRDIVKLLSSASTLGIINQEKTKCLKIIVPSLNDQNEIVEFLDKELNEISAVKKSVEQTINKLKEYRSTLITQVVTGKIDVRNLKVN